MGKIMSTALQKPVCGQWAEISPEYLFYCMRCAPAWQRKKCYRNVQLHASVLTSMWAPSALCKKLFQRYSAREHLKVQKDKCAKKQPSQRRARSASGKKEEKRSTSFEHISGNIKGINRKAKQTGSNTCQKDSVQDMIMCMSCREFTKIVQG